MKNSITNRDNDDIQRIPTIITIFIAHSLYIFMNPGHFMYPLINRFLLQRPFLDLKDIPMFYSLFQSSTNNYQKEKVWILRLLSAGLKTYDVSISKNLKIIIFKNINKKNIYIYIFVGL